ncbi:MAG TPA: diguanylate cyclase [Anaeromyxobacteraceae bacterium]|nr:diguanylate cyclase [Anaeromyxobacteraceae bacterium]
MFAFVRKRLARKLLVAVGIPSILVALAGVVWLRVETRQVAPGLWGEIAAWVTILALVTIAVHFVAIEVIVHRPLREMKLALRRARQGDFLHRVPVRGSDELAELADSFNATLKAITDLNVLRTDDALAMASMQRELALKAEVERQHALVDEANRKLEGRVSELSLLSDLSRSLNATLDLDTLCREVATLVGERLGFRAFALFLVDERQGDLFVKSAAGVHARAEGSRLAMGEGAAGSAARDGVVVRIPDIHADSRTTPSTWLPPGPGSLLAVPLVHQGACVGVLDLYRPAPNAFDDEDVRFVELAAQQVAMAVANARLHQHAVTLSLSDALTGTSNRRALFQRLELETERAERFDHTFAVAMIDVDRFGELNDAHGHLAGDKVLRQIAEILQAGIRKVDLLARHGGEEFAVVLARADREAAVGIAEKLRRAVEDANLVNAGAEGGRVTISVGVAVLRLDANRIDALVDCADAALFAAKRGGRNTVRAYAPGMRDDPHRRRDVRVTAAVEV